MRSADLNSRCQALPKNLHSSKVVNSSDFGRDPVESIARRYWIAYVMNKSRMRKLLVEGYARQLYCVKIFTHPFHLRFSDKSFSVCDKNPTPIS